MKIRDIDHAETYLPHKIIELSSCKDYLTYYRKNWTKCKVFLSHVIKF